MAQEAQDEVAESFTPEQQEWIAALVARQIAAASESNTPPPSTTSTSPGTSVTPPATLPNASSPASGGSVGEYARSGIELLYHGPPCMYVYVLH